MYPQPDIAKHLGVRTMGAGFNVSAADHEVVGVEEVPFCERSSPQSRSSGSPDESYAVYNLRQCDRPFLGT